MRWIAIYSVFLLTACSIIAGNSPQSETQESIESEDRERKDDENSGKGEFSESPCPPHLNSAVLEEWSYKMSGSGNAVKIPGLERFFGTEKDKTLVVAFDPEGCD